MRLLVIAKTPREFGPIDFVRIYDETRIAAAARGEIAWINKQTLLMAIKHEDNYTLYFLGDDEPRIVAQVESNETGTNTHALFFNGYTDGALAGHSQNTRCVGNKFRLSIRATTRFSA